MTNSPKIVILGGTGMLGHKMFQHLRRGFPGTVCTMREPVSQASYKAIELFQGGDVIGCVNAFDFEAMAETLTHLKPQFLINCIGMIKQRADALSHIPSITLNSLLPHRLTKLCAGWGGRLIHFSTDCVFSGRRGMYREDDQSDAQDLYGRSKFLGEATEANALTLRTSIIGREIAGRDSLLEWFLSHTGRRVPGYRRAIYSGVTTNHLAGVVSDIIEHSPRLQGLYQVASSPISKYELLCLLREVYGIKIVIDAVDGECADRSMDGSKFSEATGYKCPSWSSLATELATDSTPYEKWQNCGALKSQV